MESHQLGAAFIEWSSNENSVSVALSRIGHTITANSSSLRHNLISNFINDWAQVIQRKKIIIIMEVQLTIYLNSRLKIM